MSFIMLFKKDLRKMLKVVANSQINNLSSRKKLRTDLGLLNFNQIDKNSIKKLNIKIRMILYLITSSFMINSKDNIMNYTRVT